MFDWTQPKEMVSMSNFKLPEFNPGLPQLDPAVRYHAIKESDGRVSMEVVMTDVGLRVQLVCCACGEKGYLGAHEFAGTRWRSRPAFNNFLAAHKACTGKTKQFAPEPKTVTEEEGRVFRNEPE